MVLQGKACLVFLDSFWWGIILEDHSTKNSPEALAGRPLRTSVRFMQGPEMLRFGFSKPTCLGNQPPILSGKLVDVIWTGRIRLQSSEVPIPTPIAIPTTVTSKTPIRTLKITTASNHPNQTQSSIPPKMSGLASTSTQFTTIPVPSHQAHTNQPTNPTPPSQHLLPNQQPSLLEQTPRRRRRAQSQALLRVQRGESRARRVHAVFHGEGPAGRVRGYGYQISELYEGVWV